MRLRRPVFQVGQQVLQVAVAELPVAHGSGIARPGLTGAWQVSGRNDVDYHRRVALDRDYVEDWSFRRDLVILVKTVRVVATARGCY